MIFAVTDIETTGSYASANSITEIAVVLTDGTEILDQFHTLLRPEHAIPPYIMELTGITNDMVVDAPRFEEIAEELYAWFEDAVFVAHNVGFDYAFIKKSFEEYGMRFNPKRLCTVRMSRKILPGHRSYSLGRICEDLGIGNEARHRALGDTMATVQLFHHLMLSDQAGVIDGMLKRGSAEQWLPPALPREVFDELPEKPGVYYFIDRHGKFIYIGMSINVKKRIRQHFGGKMASSRRQEFLKDIVDIQVTLTGTELIARLLEDAEIRQHWPRHNRAQKRPKSRFGIVSYLDQLGYKRLTVQKLQVGSRPIEVYYSMTAARDRLISLVREFNLHASLCGVTMESGPMPEVSAYNQLIDQMAIALRNQDGIRWIEGQGRHYDERSLVVIEGGQLKGYAFISPDESVNSEEDLLNFTTMLPSSEMTHSIMAPYLPHSKSIENISQ
ncbi:MAG: GIY-YIG nuclease family protein [Flavobacteriales bacterium]|nr:GIY-YIG nuclease family protein [Flavobacteriales bacterium]